MIIFVPLNNNIKSFSKILNKVKRAKIFAGIYKGYNFEEDTTCTMVKGVAGWNLFINEEIEQERLSQSLAYLLKNKSRLLFMVESMHEIEAQFKIKK